jgi:phosphonate transport system permease protein
VSSSPATSRISVERLRMLEQRYPRAFSMSLRDRIVLYGGMTALAVFFIVCIVRFDISLTRIWNGLDRIGYILFSMFPPGGGGAYAELFGALLETLAMAFLGTLIASLVALPLGFLGAKNMLPNWFVRFVFRRQFDFLRGLDSLIWALVYVRAVGLGPLAGVLAIATSDTGALAKLYSEAIENTEKKQVEGVRASGANALQSMRFGILPQVLPVMLSNALYLFESNTRSATILGIVGAGGIGFQLADRIRAHRWDEVCFIILMIVVTVALIDAVSHQIRKRFIEAGKTRRLVEEPAG